tara:strand:- start:2306 stop:2686 length:381 start_codon:yes stop_codon:yes gene_type:complete
MSDNYTDVSGISKNPDSAGEVKEFFNKYFTKQISYTSNQVDSVVGFFEKRGFEKQSAIAVSTVILQQAALEKTPVYSILDTLKGLSEVQISKLVTTIINVNRSKSSALGYQVLPLVQSREARNIVL